MKKALVTEIRKASFHDGPGVRTVVFFKGCPLRCAWCHNPECLSFEKQILFYPEKCVGCGLCEKGCYLGAKVPCGREMTAGEIFAEILTDKEYFGDEGGVTFSGGKPLSHSEIILELIKKCHDNGIKCAVETSLYIWNEDILRACDLVMADFKIWDSATHERYTGVSNERIKENFLRLDTLGVPVIVRTPVIPEIDQGIDKISEFVKELKNAVSYELLPYHPLGKSKYDALGKAFTEFSVPSKEYMKGLSEKYVFVRKKT